MSFSSLGGEKGDAPGQFDLPHDVCVHKDGRVFVADRQNHRIQIFDQDGIPLDMWTGFKQPCSVYIDSEERVYVTELQARMSILDIEGNLLARWGEENSKGPGLFIAPTPPLSTLKETCTSVRRSRAVGSRNSSCKPGQSQDQVSLIFSSPYIWSDETWNIGCRICFTHLNNSRNSDIHVIKNIRT